MTPDKRDPKVTAADEYFESEAPPAEESPQGPEDNAAPLKNYLRELKQEFDEQNEEGKM
jgi:hypothetical protein